jgi:hypothetical protein
MEKSVRTAKKKKINMPKISYCVAETSIKTKEIPYEQRCNVTITQ